MSLSGRNWGSIDIGDTAVSLLGDDGKPIITVPYVNMLSCSSARGDVTISLMDSSSNSNNGGTSEGGAATPVEVRFAIPNKARGLSNYEDPSKTFVQLVQDKITSLNPSGGATSRGGGGGDVKDDGTSVTVAQFDNIHFSAPSGEFNLTFTTTLMKMYDVKKQQTYVIPLSSVTCMFLLPFPTPGRKYLSIALTVPLRVGSTSYPQVVMVFDDDEVFAPESPYVPLATADQITSLLSDPPGLVTSSMVGPFNEVMVKFLKVLTKKKLIGQGSFRSSSGSPSVKCVFKGQTGYLYFLEKSLLFLHRPATYLKVED
eukprot:PhF_6_TR6922/c0_g1_i5/m.10102/K09272/SSRP1; structure-specific recognition protein 1